MTDKEKLKLTKETIVELLELKKGDEFSQEKFVNVLHKVTIISGSNNTEYYAFSVDALKELHEEGYFA